MEHGGTRLFIVITHLGPHSIVVTHHYHMRCSHNFTVWRQNSSEALLYYKIYLFIRVEHVNIRGKSF